MAFNWFLEITANDLQKLKFNIRCGCVALFPCKLTVICIIFWNCFEIRRLNFVVSYSWVWRSNSILPFSCSYQTNIISLKNRFLKNVQTSVSFFLFKRDSISLGFHCNHNPLVHQRLRWSQSERRRMYSEAYENGKKDIRSLTYGWRNCRRGGSNNIYRRLGQPPVFC